MVDKDMVKIVRGMCSLIFVISALFFYKGVTQVWGLHTTNGTVWTIAMGVICLLSLLGVFWKFGKKKKTGDTEQV